jgi:hypothetical protein
MVGGRQREAMLKRNAAEPVQSPEKMQMELKYKSEDLKMKEIDKLLRELVGVGGIQERLSQNYWFANGERKQQFKKDLNRKAEIEKILESLES